MFDRIIGPKTSSEAFLNALAALTILNLFFGGTLLMTIDEPIMPRGTMGSFVLLIFGIVFVSASGIALKAFIKIVDSILEPPE